MREQKSQRSGIWKATFGAGGVGAPAIAHLMGNQRPCWRTREPLWHVKAGSWEVLIMGCIKVWSPCWRVGGWWRVGVWCCLHSFCFEPKTRFVCWPSSRSALNAVSLPATNETRGDAVLLSRFTLLRRRGGATFFCCYCVFGIRAEQMFCSNHKKRFLFPVGWVCSKLFIPSAPLNTILIEHLLAFTASRFLL